MPENCRKRAFGVGCFNFRSTRSAPFRLPAKEYEATLRKALSRLNALTDLEIEYDETTKDSEFEISDEIPAMQDGGVFPFLQFGHISFTLFIPERIQEELVSYPATATEHFRVTIRDQFWGPVACVECMDAGDDCSPSNAVQLIRKYLSKEINVPGCEVQFEYLGPSPFHANFFVTADRSRSDVVVNEIPVPGYDTFEIAVGTASSEEDPVDLAFDSLFHELDLYYFLVRQRNIQLREWEALEQTWSALRDTLVSDVKLYQVVRRFSIHRRARDLVTAAYTFAAENSISKQDAHEAYRTVYGKALSWHIKSRCEVQLTDAYPAFPTETITAWATHIYDSSFKAAEIMSVLISGILGGLVGALLTASVTSGGTEQVRSPPPVTSNTQR